MQTILMINVVSNQSTYNRRVKKEEFLEDLESFQDKVLKQFKIEKLSKSWERIKIFNPIYMRDENYIIQFKNLSKNILFKVFYFYSSRKEKKEKENQFLVIFFILLFQELKESIFIVLENILRFQISKQLKGYQRILLIGVAFRIVDLIEGRHLDPCEF